MSQLTSPNLRNLVRLARDRVRDGHRSIMFQRAMRRLMRDPIAAASESSPVLEELFFGWGNESWSGEPELLRSCIQQAEQAHAAILECGSGLSTIILGAVAQRIGIKVWALEHMPDWADRVQQHLDSFGIDAVRICMTPLRSYGEYDWYVVPPDVSSEQFDFVLCDGPPSQTNGGRYGLVPLLKPQLVKGCVILLDDAERESEQQIALRWSSELPCVFTRTGHEKPFFRLVVDSGNR